MPGIDTASSRAWRPLLDGSTATAARAEIARIADFLATPRARDQALGGGLALGHAGVALFFGYAHRAHPKRRYHEVAEERMELALHAAEHKTGASLFSGVTGIAWAMQHLDEGIDTAIDHDIDDDSDDDDVQLDRALAELVAESPWTGRRCLLLGLAGYGLYALERIPTAPAMINVLADVVERLGELAVHDGDGCHWPTDPEHLGSADRAVYPAGYTETGVAHGACGVLSVLAGAAARAAHPAAEPLLTKGVGWLLGHRRSIEHPSVFPARIAPSGPEAGDCRLAWCQGDIGIAAALSAIAEAAGRSDWHRAAIEIALRAAQRDPDRAGVEDPALCHGALGVAHLLNRLYQAAGDPRLAASARSWLDRGLALLRAHPSSGGYPRLAHPPPGFLQGAAGVGLALLAATTDIEPRWDRLLCASVAPGFVE